jgi:hypothetical protein
MKQLMGEKQKLEEKAGLDLQLAHKLLTSGELVACLHCSVNEPLNSSFVSLFPEV